MRVNIAQYMRVATQLIFLYLGSEASNPIYSFWENRTTHFAFSFLLEIRLMLFEVENTRPYL